MIKNRSDFFFGLFGALVAALAFAGRNTVRGLWLGWLVISAILIYRSLTVPPKPFKAAERSGLVPSGNTFLASVVLPVAVFLAAPLWVEFSEPHQLLWNGFLALFLLALMVGSFVGVRYLQKNRIEVGEARFTPARRAADERIQNEARDLNPPNRHPGEGRDPLGS